MPYPLEPYSKPASSLVFWLGKYVKYKLNSLSNKFVLDPKSLLEANLALEDELDLSKLSTIAKYARNAGLIGINTYYNPLKKLCAQLSRYSITSLKQIDEPLVAEILNSITAGLSDASKKNHRIAVLNFFKFVSEQNSDNHIFRISLKSWGGVSGAGGVKLPEYMNEKQLRRFIACLNSFDFAQHTERNRLLIKIILFSGMRVSEALYLRVKDITLVDNIYQVRIHAKGNKYRLVMIEASCIKPELLEVISGKTPNDYLFYNHKTNKVLTQAYVSRIIEKILITAGIRKEKNGAHMLRHSFATLLYQKEKDILLVQEALGHASLETSRIYTHFDNEKLKVAAAIATRLNERK